MATSIVYDPQYVIAGWFDDGGMAMISWLDRDLAGTVIPLVVAEVPLFFNTNVIFTPPPITVEVLAGFFVNQSDFLGPKSVRAYGKPDQMLKNEVRRIR